MSEKITAMIEEIKGLSVLELAELVHALEDTFGVSAAAVAAPAAGAAAGPVVEEKTEFDVVMTEFGAEKIKVIKEVGSRLQGRCGSPQGPARSCWREGRAQVSTPCRVSFETAQPFGFVPFQRRLSPLFRTIFRLTSFSPSTIIF